MTRRAELVAWLCVLACARPGAAAPPDVVPVRVPADKVEMWFPPGTELKSVSVAEIEALDRASRAGAARRLETRSPRILHARHSARWADGVLKGSSELVVESNPLGSGEVVLEPWTPAIEPMLEQKTTVAADDRGRVLVRIDPGAATKIVLAWRLRSIEGSNGRRFALGLPAVAASELRLDLPEALVPEGSFGVRQGPHPTNENGRSVWKFSSRGGLEALTLNDRDSKQDDSTAPALWCNGPTRIDVTESVAHWTLDLSVSGGSRSPRRLTLELDPELELVGVTGENVAGYQSERSRASTRVTMNLKVDGAAALSTRVTVRALATVPSQGRWRVPSARPANAIWKGGTTAVRLDASRHLIAVTPLAGRQVAAPPSAVGDDRELVFEGESPGPVAELLLGGPVADLSASVSGRLLVGESSARLECRVVWNVNRGVLHNLALDMPSGWTPDRVVLEESGVPVAWHTEVRGDRRTQVHVRAASGAAPGRPIALILFATLVEKHDSSELGLPRVRPVAARVGDEVWTAAVLEGITLRPTRARGLAWLDPAKLPQAAAQVTGGSTPNARIPLAWRWTLDDAEGIVARERAAPIASGVVDMLATVTNDHLRIDARISIPERNDAMGTLAVGLSESLGDVSSWHAFENATNQEIVMRPIPREERVDTLAGVAGPAWSIELPRARRARLELTLRYDGLWSGSGRIPSMILPGVFQRSGVVLVRVGRNLRTSARARSARVLDPDVAADSLTLDAAAAGASPGGLESVWDPGDTTFRRAHAFSHDRDGGVVELETKTLAARAHGGVIREAVLTTHAGPLGWRRNRLTLRVAPEDTEAVEVDLPAGTKLERVRREGQTVTPRRLGGSISIPLGSAAKRSTTTLTLDYHLPSDVAGDPAKVRALRPVFSLPCLALAWEVVVPEHWFVVSWGPSLTPADAGAPPFLGLLDRILARQTSGNTSSAGQKLTSLSKMFENLDARVASSRHAEMSLCEWFTHWDAGAWPLVIDRVAVSAAGLGPKSRFLLPERRESAKPDTALASLRRLGLTVAPVSGVFVVTDPATGFGLEAGRLVDGENAIDAATRFGSDPSDRFQSVARWRDEETPRQSSGVETNAGFAPSEGRTTRRFGASGWPKEGVTVIVADARTRERWSVTVMLAVLFLGAAARGRSRAFRAMLATAVLGFGLLAREFVIPPWDGVGDGMIIGVTGSLLFWLGASLPSLVLRRPRARPSTRSSVSRRAGRSSVTSLLILGSILHKSEAQPTTAPDEPQDTIVVVFPYEGPLDPLKKPDRGLMRLDDFRKLQSLAYEAERVTPTPLRAASVLHHVSTNARGELLIESLIEFLEERAGPAEWSFPVEAARELRGKLDGAETPVRIEPGGRTAVVLVPPGARRLVIGRIVTPRKIGNVESIAIPINPAPNARLVVERRGDLRPGAPNARGIVDSEAGRLEAMLGPVDRLDVKWTSAVGRSAPAEEGAIDALYLWDATPAGDRVRARLTFRDPRGMSVLRIAHEPGLVVREATFPNAVDLTSEGSDEQPEWVARIDPPLRDGSTAVLDIWRPRPAAPSGATRRAPWIVPIGVPQVSVTIGLRKPPDWAGRLSPAAASVAVTEESFVRAWGTLPDDNLTLSGAVTLLRASSPELLPTLAGPKPDRAKVTPTVQITISPGRLDLAVEADIREPEGTVHELDLEWPRGLHVVHVSADGLTDWNFAAPAEETLRLRFDGLALRQRRVRVEGWIAVDRDALSATAKLRELALPWPGWAGADVLVGGLEIKGTVPFSLVSENATVVAKSEPTDADASTGAVNRLTRRVDPREGPLRLRWEDESPRVAVQVQSQLTLHPASAEWLAVVRYDVAGGPLDGISLKLPSEWARSASVRVDGQAVRPLAETRGETTWWSIHSENPIWGERRVEIESSLPLEPGGVLAFPDLSPLGRSGGAAVALRLVNATGRGISIEGATGLEPVAPATLSIDEALVASAPKAAPVDTFRAARPGWTLRARRPIDSTGDGASARPGLADLTCVVGADGSLLGLGRYELGPDAGPLFEFGLATGSEPIWATVNGLSVRLLSAGAERWVIPLAENEGSRVAFVWRQTAPARLALTPTEIRLPVVDHEHLPTLVTAFAPEGISVEAATPGLQVVTASRIALERARRVERRMLELLAEAGKNSDERSDELTAALVRCGVLLRSAERASAKETRDAGRGESRALVTRLAADRVRARLSAALEKAELSEVEATANGYLGLTSANSAESLPVPPEPAPSARVRMIGVPAHFAGDVHNPVLVWTREPSSHGITTRRTLAIVAWSTAAVLGAWLLVWYAAASTLVARLTLASTLLTIAIFAGPWWLAAGAGAAVLGRFVKA